MKGGKYMFIVNLNYVKPMEEVEKYLEEHIAFLDHYYREDKFICSGRKNPRTGGIILANVEDKETMERIISNDPFYENKIATYEVTEFIPTKYADAFSSFLL